MQNTGKLSAMALKGEELNENRRNAHDRLISKEKIKQNPIQDNFLI